MDITAHNYATQVEGDLMLSKSIIDAAACRSKPFPKGYEADVDERLKIIREAQHFAVPDGGLIFDDDLKGLNMSNVRLPFPCVTVSCNAPGDDGPIRKLFITAKEGFVAGEEHCEGIFVASFIFVHSRWLHMPFVLFKASCSTNAESYQLLIPDQKHYDHAANELTKNIVEMEEHINGLALRTVLELLEALNCKNVTTEPINKINPKVNAKRIRKNKTPLYEVKKLVLVQPNESSTKTSTGTGRSPRAHLRRGHIRRYASGNVWIQATTVGNVDNGFLHKNYDVKAEEIV